MSTAKHWAGIELPDLINRAEAGEMFWGMDNTITPFDLRTLRALCDHTYQVAGPGGYTSFGFGTGWIRVHR